MLAFRNFIHNEIVRSVDSNGYDSSFLSGVPTVHSTYAHIKEDKDFFLPCFLKTVKQLPQTIPWGFVHADFVHLKGQQTFHNSALWGLFCTVRAQHGHSAQ